MQLFNRSPGREGSHFDPKSPLFTDNEGPMIETSNKFQCAWLGFLAGCTVALGPMAMLNLYVLPCEARPRNPQRSHRARARWCSATLLASWRRAAVWRRAAAAHGSAPIPLARARACARPAAHPRRPGPPFPPKHRLGVCDVAGCGDLPAPSRPQRPRGGDALVGVVRRRARHRRAAHPPCCPPCRGWGRPHVSAHLAGP